MAARNPEFGGREYLPYDAEPRVESREAAESEVDLRHESEVFMDHERIDNARDVDDELMALRDQLSEDSDGIIHLDIPAYRYDFQTNPFVEMGPTVVKTYEIARYLDVVFLHRFMYQDILVCGVSSREFVGESGRAAWIKKLRDTGGLPLDTLHDTYDMMALEFAPFVSYHSILKWFDNYHKQPPYRDARPHYPIDVWMIFDAHAYEKIATPDVGFRDAWRLIPGIDRRASLIGLAQIN